MTGRPLRFFAGMVAFALAWQVLDAAAQDSEAERDLGRRFVFEAGSQIPLVRDPEAVAYVRRIGQRIVDGLGSQPFEYKFFVVRDARVNAFAVPGGYVYVNGGLLLRAGNDDEVAGVLGHEIAHVNAHHLLRQQDATQWLGYAQILGLVASIVQPALGAAAVGATATAQLQYKREFEQEADYLGARYVQQAGFAPRGMLDFFQKLWEEQRLASNGVPPYLLSHPLTEERLTRLEAVLRTSQWSGGARPAPSADLERARFMARLRTEPAAAVLTSAQEQVAQHPNDAEAHYQLGAVLLETGSFEAARVSLEQARSLGRPGVERELGRALFRLRQPEKAREQLANAVEANPSDPVALCEYGRVLEGLGDAPGAMAAYGRAVRLDADFEEAQRQLGLLLGRDGQVGLGHYHLAKAYLLRGEYPEARSQLEKAETQLAPGEELIDAQATLTLLRNKGGKPPS